ncbi:MAG: DUF2239 family protein [Rhizomicrobium sp.]|nr:DUF2239 family protein [Rhizomicrobium sp.]
MLASRRYTAFAASKRLASGGLGEVALAVKAAITADPEACLLTFDDATGKVVDLDLRGTEAEILARLPAASGGPTTETETRGPGRPKLGVVAREITLLPRHWDWLAAQPGGASQAVRRLVEQARRADGGKSQARAAQAAAYSFMATMAGNLAGFEEASRALFAGDQAGFALHMAPWPPDIRHYAETLAHAQPEEI